MTHDDETGASASTSSARSGGASGGGAARAPGLTRGTILLDTYEVEGRIGAGGFGTVYEARHRQLGHLVAVKVGRLGAGCDEQRERFRQEALLGARLKSPHLVAVHEAGETQRGEPFLVMERILGPDLRAFLARGPITPAATLDLCVQACAGLAVLDACDVVHRDLKPQNIMLERDAAGLVTVKLVDLGVTGRSGARRRTDPDALVGTPRYMAPEQLHGEPLDVRTDLYALGCVLYECLTRRSPISGSNLLSQARRTLEHRVRPLARLAPDVPRQIRELVEQLIAPRPEDRPHDPLELRDAATRIALELGLPTGAAAWAPFTERFERAAPGASSPPPSESLDTAVDPFSTERRAPSAPRWLGPLAVAGLLLLVVANVVSLLWT